MQMPLRTRCRQIRRGEWLAPTRLLPPGPRLPRDPNQVVFGCILGHSVGQLTQPPKILQFLVEVAPQRRPQSCQNIIAFLDGRLSSPPTTDRGENSNTKPERVTLLCTR